MRTQILKLITFVIPTLAAVIAFGSSASLATPQDDVSALNQLEVHPHGMTLTTPQRADQLMTVRSRKWDALFNHSLGSTAVELSKERDPKVGTVIFFDKKLTADAALSVLEVLQKRGVNDLAIMHRGKRIRACHKNATHCFGQAWSKGQSAAQLALMVRRDGVDVESAGQRFDGSSKGRPGQALVPFTRGFQKRLHQNFDDLYVHGAPLAMVVHKNAPLFAFLDTLAEVQQPLVFAARSPFHKASTESRSKKMSKIFEGLSLGDLDVAKGPLSKKQSVRSTLQSANIAQQNKIKSQRLGRDQEIIATRGQVQRANAQKRAASVVAKKEAPLEETIGDPMLEKAFSAYLSKHAGIEGCFATQRRETKVVLDVVVGENGDIAKVTPLKKSARMGCVTRAVAKLKFPKSGQRVSFRNTFIFQGG